VVEPHAVGLDRHQCRWVGAVEPADEPVAVVHLDLSLPLGQPAAPEHLDEARLEHALGDAIGRCPGLDQGPERSDAVATRAGEPLQHGCRPPERGQSLSERGVEGQLEHLGVDDARQVDERTGGLGDGDPVEGGGERSGQDTGVVEAHARGAPCGHISGHRHLGCRLLDPVERPEPRSATVRHDAVGPGRPRGGEQALVCAGFAASDPPDARAAERFEHPGGDETRGTAAVDAEPAELGGRDEVVLVGRQAQHVCYSQVCHERKYIERL
jgi:hypothetical protein